jgi:hypothetical protein
MALARFLWAELAGEQETPDAPDAPIEIAAADEPIAIVAMGCRFPEA